MGNEELYLMVNNTTKKKPWKGIVLPRLYYIGI